MHTHIGEPEQQKKSHREPPPPHPNPPSPPFSPLPHRRARRPDGYKQLHAPPALQRVFRARPIFVALPPTRQCVFKIAPPPEPSARTLSLHLFPPPLSDHDYIVLPGTAPSRFQIDAKSTPRAHGACGAGTNRAKRPAGGPLEVRWFAGRSCLPPLSLSLSFLLRRWMEWAEASAEKGVRAGGDL
jgi:hypothetical protein